MAFKPHNPGCSADNCCDCDSARILELDAQDIEVDVPASGFTLVNVPANFCATIPPSQPCSPINGTKILVHYTGLGPTSGVWAYWYWGGSACGLGLTVDIICTGTDFQVTLTLASFVGSAQSKAQYRDTVSNLRGRDLVLPIIAGDPSSPGSFAKCNITAAPATMTMRFIS